MSGTVGLRGTCRLGVFLASLAASAAIAQLGLVTEASAESADKVKIAVGAFSGAKNAEVRRAFLDALKKNPKYEVTDAPDVKTWTKPKAVGESARGMGVDGVVSGKIGKGFVLKLKVVGSDGKVAGEGELQGGSLAKLKESIEKDGATSIAGSVAQLPSAEDEEDEEEEPKAKQDAKAEVDASTAAAGERTGLSPLDVSVGVRGLHRTFAFNQTIADLRPGDNFAQFLKYKLPLGPAIFVDLNWFPASHFTRGAAEWFGLTAGFEKAFATKSVYPATVPVTLKTNENAYYLGARFRFPIGQHLVGATATFGQHTFALDGDEAAPLVPDVKYTYVKLGLDGTLHFGKLSAGARLGKRFVSSTGALESAWFPHVKTQSLEAGLNAGYRIHKRLELIVGFDWLRYAFDFNPVTQRAGSEGFVAGGAQDEYLSGQIGVRFHLPGAAEKAAEGQ